MRRPPLPILRSLLPTLLLCLSADLAECQSDNPNSPNDPRGSDPGAVPWSAPGTIPGSGPGSAARQQRPPKDDRDDFWRRMDMKPKGLRFRLLEVEALGRLYVQDLSGVSRYWLQLSRQVKIRTAYPDSFGGRKKLKLKDLEVGQLLIVTLRRSDGEILTVVVRPVEPEEDEPEEDEPEEDEPES